MILKYIRHFILLISIFVAITIYLVMRIMFHTVDLQDIRIVEIYGFLSIALLYVSLLPGPLYRVFPNLPFKVISIKARRATGVSAFFFGLLHSTISFFSLLGGFNGLGFLSNGYLISVIAGFFGLIIMAAMAATSFDMMVQKLAKKWKWLHRLIYIGGLIIIIHIFLLGTHFLDLTAIIPQVFFAAIVFLLLLEAKATDMLLWRKFPSFPKFGVLLLAVEFLAAYIVLSFFVPQGSSGAASSFNIHAQHIAIAKQAQQGSVGSNLPSNIPGLNGDRTRRYTVSFFAPPSVLANQDIQLRFRIYDASSGNQVVLFTPVYTKLMHLVIVNQELDYFMHIHPDLSSSGDFIITTRFPKDDIYHLYVDFQPIGSIEQQFGFTLLVGQSVQTVAANQPADTNLTKIFGSYQVTMTPKVPLVATQMAIGLVPLDFTIKDAKTGQGITTLKPYLGAFGHLVLINEKTYDYIHVHPSMLTQPPPDANTGPTVEFLPLGLYGPIKPGTYRVYAQLNPDNNLFVADFTVTVQ